jgi:hypothetical protein
MALIWVNIKKLHLRHDEKEYLLVRSMKNNVLLEHATSLKAL